ncbi:hypothetical protein BC827DRAFT_1225801 [Russula dissimulans]|nr:hypothetical protein BC827DRAFT_1225801 [Russula dissimulans]
MCSLPRKPWGKPWEKSTMVVVAVQGAPHFVIFRDIETPTRHRSAGVTGHAFFPFASGQVFHQNFLLKLSKEIKFVRTRGPFELGVRDIGSFADVAGRGRPDMLVNYIFRRSRNCRNTIIVALRPPSPDRRNALQPSEQRPTKAQITHVDK